MMTRKQAIAKIAADKAAKIAATFTTRDRFATAALQGMLASVPLVDRTTVNKAVWVSVAYEFADAMLKERTIGTMPKGISPARRRMKTRAAKWVVILAILFGASTANAGPITASISGCGKMPNGGTWTGDAIGFVFFAAHDPESGCEPTIRNPTSGVYRTFVNAAGQYEAEVRPEWLPTCGRVQFDAQAYTATGLDPNQLHTFVFDTGVDCSRRHVLPDGRVTTTAEQSYGPFSIVTPDSEPPTTLDDPPNVCATCTIDPHDLTPVPEPEAFVMMALGLAVVVWRVRA